MDFKDWKLKWEKPNEVRAIWEMGKAMEVVYREYKEWINKTLNWFTFKESFPKLTDELLLRLERIYLKDYDISPTLK